MTTIITKTINTMNLSNLIIVLIEILLFNLEIEMSRIKEEADETYFYIEYMKKFLIF